MKWEDIQRKLTSRKFWLAVAGFVGPLMLAFGASEAVASQVTALIMAGAAVVAYIIGEGMADAASAGGVTNIDGADVLKAIEIVDEKGKQDDHSGDGE